MGLFSSRFVFRIRLKFRVWIGIYMSCEKEGSLQKKTPWCYPHVSTAACFLRPSPPRRASAVTQRVVVARQGSAHFTR